MNSSSMAPSVTATLKRISTYHHLRAKNLLPCAFCLLLSTFCFVPAARAQESAAKPSQTAPRAAGPHSDPKSQELLDRVIQALGGQAFLNFKSITSRGRAFSIYEGETTGFAPYVSEVVPPDKRKFEYGKKQPVILLNNGDRGWEQDRYGLIRLKPESVKRWQLSMRYNLESIFRRVVREPGTLILDGGVDFVDLLPARVLEITDSRQADIKVYLGKSDNLPIRITYRVYDPKAKETNEYSDSYSDYRPIQGIQTPMHMARSENGRRVLEYFLSAAQYNQEFPDGYFQPTR